MRRARRMSPGSLEVVSPREAASSASVILAFERTSRVSGESHIVSVDQATMQPIGCSCLAGQRRLLCWAVLDVMGLEMASGMLVSNPKREACGGVQLSPMKSI